MIRRLVVRAGFSGELLPVAFAVAALVCPTIDVSAQTTGSAELSGTVVTRGDRTFDPVHNADIIANSKGRLWRAQTDAEGRFGFSGLEPAVYTLRVTQVGYRPATVEVDLTGGRAVSVEIVLTVDPVALSGVDVRGGRAAGSAGEPSDDAANDLRGADAATLSAQALEGGSGMAASGMTRMFSGVPGNDPGDPGDVLFMRGSSMDMKVVLLDGAPLYTPFHVSGLLPAFDPGLLTSAKVHNGGVPSEYDGGLTHVLDLRTRSARGGEASLTGAADLLSARVGARLPMGERSGVAVGARGLHGAAEELMGSGFPYGYGDVVARADLGLAENHSVEATGFLNQESVDLDFGAPSGPGFVRPTVLDFPSEASWGNSALSLGYLGRGDRTALTLRGAFTRYDAELPILSELPLFASGSTERRRVVGHLERRLDRGFVRVGASADRIDLAYSARRLASDTLPALPAVRSSGNGSVVALFADGGIQIRPTVRVGGGLRLARYLGDEARLAPHVSVTWLFGDDAALTISAGRSDQLSTASDDGVAESLGVEALEDPTTDPNTALVPPATSLLSVARASHVVVSLDQFVSERTRLGLDGWLRRYSGLGAQQPEELNASGIDLRIVRAGSTIDGWFGYSLSWYWSPSIDAPDPFQGRQLLSAGLNGRISEEGRASVQISFGDGLPFTAISTSTDGAAAPGMESGFEVPDQRNFESITEASQGNPPLVGGPSGDFLRIDGEVAWTVRPRWGGHTLELRPYVRLINALNRRDAMFYYFEAWRDAEVRPLAELSIMPIVGFSWHF